MSLIVINSINSYFQYFQFWCKTADMSNNLFHYLYINLYTFTFISVFIYVLSC